MPEVAVERIDSRQTANSTVAEDLRALSERIRQHAFEIFESRGRREGAELSDWLDAERDLLWIPESELVDRDGKFRARVSAPGFEPEDIQITATPDALIIKAESIHKHNSVEGDVRFCDFENKILFRRIDFPVPIDVDKVTANLDKGVLQVTAFKLETS